MRKYRKVIIIIIILMAALLVAVTGLMSPGVTQTRECSLIYIPKIKDDTNDFWSSLISGCKMAAEEYGSKLEIMAPDKEENIEEQNRLLKAAIEKEPDAILFSPSSMSASDKLLKKAKEKGIRITYIDSYTEEELQDLTVATDNVEAGRRLGEYARTLLDKDSRLAIVSHVKGVSTAVERAVGVGRAVSDAGAKDRIAVVGVDCSQEAINLMEMGVYKGIIVQKAFRMGYMGVEETIHMLNGDSVAKNIDSGCELVTPDNMYDSDIERLIFPFY